MTKASAAAPPLKIMVVVHRINGRSGGAERVVVDTANRLNARGADVEIVTFDPKPGRPFYPLDFGIAVTNLNGRIADQRFVRRMFNLAVDRTLKAVPAIGPRNALKWRQDYGTFAARLRRHIELQRPDVVVPVMPPAITVAAIAAAGLAPVAASTHNVPSQDFDNPERWDPNPHDRRLRLEALRKADLVMVLLPEFLSWFEERGMTRVAVVPNAIEPVDPALLAGARRRPTIISVGRLAKVKQHDKLIRAWKLIADKHPDWSVAIYGVGPDKAALAALIKELDLSHSVRLMGHTTNIQAAYLSASLMVHPAEFEGFGLAPAEALASGLPVIGYADCSGLNQLVKDGVNGLLVHDTTDRVAGLAARIDELITDGDLRNRLAAAGPASMRDYAPDRVTDLWLDLLNRAIASHAKG